MPRILTLKLNNMILNGFLKPFSRDSVYGKSKMERRGSDGSIFHISNLTSDGTHIVPYGGIGELYHDMDGKIVKNTRIVDSEGNDIPVIKSMFKKPIVIKETIDLKDYFRYVIERTYLLQLEDNKSFYEECINLKKQGKLFKFRYAYYDTTVERDAVLIPKDNQIIVVVGNYEAPIMLRQEEVIHYAEELEEIEKDIEFEVW